MFIWCNWLRPRPWSVFGDGIHDFHICGQTYRMLHVRIREMTTFWTLSVSLSHGLFRPVAFSLGCSCGDGFGVTSLAMGSIFPFQGLTFYLSRSVVVVGQCRVAVTMLFAPVLEGSPLPSCRTWSLLKLVFGFANHPHTTRYIPQGISWSKSALLLRHAKTVSLAACRHGNKQTAI